jgi:hypothetical protein
MRTQLRRCPSCGGDRDFEAPPCADGHGADCPERACLQCGAALLVDPLVPRSPRPRRRAFGAAA